jgi:Domain of unknown function (DUF1905)
MPKPAKTTSKRKTTAKKTQAQMDPALARFIREELGTPVDNAQSWSLTAPLWIWKGKDANGAPTATSWYFLTIGGEAAAQIRAAGAGRSTGWGMVKVRAIIGSTEFETSLFPNKSEASFMLPVKATVRKAEKIADGDAVAVTIMLAG